MLKIFKCNWSYTTKPIDCNEFNTNAWVCGVVNCETVEYQATWGLILLLNLNHVKDKCQGRCLGLAPEHMYLHWLSKGVS